MKKIFTLLSLFIATVSFAQTGLRITEISYNPPEAGSDSTEYIEIYNPTSSAINLNGYSFTSGIIYTFGNVSIPAAGYVVVCGDSVAMQNRFGIAAYTWTGGLSNGGEPIALKDNLGVLVDSLRYDDNSPWPTSPDSYGPSLVLCDLTVDQTNGANWDTSSTSTGIMVNGHMVYGSPGAADNACTPQPADLVITEIMYNTPGSDTFEFIEIYNNGSSSVDLSGYHFTQGVTGTLPSINLAAGAYITVTIDSVGFYNVFGSSAYQWQAGGLSNSGEDITLVDNLGNTIDSVYYDDTAPWPTDADGLGYSLVLVDPNSDNLLASSWCLSGDSVMGQVISGAQILASPGSANTCYMAPPPPSVIPTYAISNINNTDANGVADSIGVYCWTKGLVMGVDMRGGTGIQFTLFDGEGIGVFNFSNVSNYAVTEGDSILIRSTVGQFNGLTQLTSIDSIQLVNTGNTIPTPTVVTTLTEAMESTLVTFEDAFVSAVSGSNYTLVNGTDTITMRVDSDTDVLDSLSIAMGDSLCHVTGIVGQFDSSNPYTSGYQLFPRTYMDVDTTCGTPVAPPATPTYAISDINNTDANGVADSNGVYCWTKGLVLGVNMRPSGLQFTIFDGEGIGVFNTSGVNSYVVTEGDSIMIKGTVGQYNGLTQLTSIDSIQLVNTGNTIPTPTVVTTLTEAMESTLVTFEDAFVSAVSGSNYTLVNGTDTITMRVDSDTDVLDSLSIVIGDSLCHVTGIVGQFDSSNPYTSGYQLFPRTYMDVDTTCGTPVTPPATPTYAISDINNTDANGVADSNGVYCWTKGLVLGVNMRPSGLQFTIFDGEGIGVFNTSGVNSYVVTEGDSIMIKGTVGQYNGLTQLTSIDSIQLVNTGNTIPTPTVVTTLTEVMESTLVTFEDAFVSAYSNSNYTLVSGTDTITMRVDSDTDVLDSLSIVIGDSLCHVTGIVGQFDSSNPYTSGYQLFPRTYMDVDTTCGGTINPPAPTIPIYDISTVRTNDADGVPDSIGVYCALEGIVLGTNLHTGGLSFTLHDGIAGIGVFIYSYSGSYIVNQGDEVIVYGEIDHYNGLAQIQIDSVNLISTGHCIDFPEIVFDLNEETESEPIQLIQVMIADPSAWPSPGSNANMDIVTMDGDTLLMRIDRDGNIADTILSAPTGYFNLSGIGSQFDGSAPHDEGYQIMPQFVSDFDTVPSTASGLFINEVMVDNQTVIADPQGDYDSWIEIYNSNSTAVDLTGYIIGNDDTTYVFSRCESPVIVPANGYTLLWADDEMEDGSEHLPFELLDEDFLGFATKDFAILDTTEWDSALMDVSIGHDTDGSGIWVSFEVSTPNATNSNGVILSVINALSVNSLNAYPNPASTGNINFNKVISFRMFSITGQMVSTQFNVNSLDISDLENGIYIIETTEGEVVKVIIN